MYEQHLVDHVFEQLRAPRHTAAEQAELAEYLLATLDRLTAHLRDHGIERLEDTSLEVLRQFEFHYAGNDDHHLRLVFSHLGRPDLNEHIAMVSADKYFQNKKLTVALKEIDDFAGHQNRLRQTGIRMASELLERGATPEGRAQLTGASGVPPDTLLQMVHCCDLCRMTGMGGQTLKRARHGVRHTRQIPRLHP